MNDFEQLSRIIRERRSIFPKMYTDEKIDDQVIQQILENANWAPNHRKTEPWRFQVFTGNALDSLSDYLADHYLNNTPSDQYSEIKHKKKRDNPLRSSHVIALCMQRDSEERLPEWEELAAMACAVQNMWLSCTALGLGCYWSSPKAALEADEFFELKAGEKCFGLFYIGVPVKDLTLHVSRKPIEEKVIWKR